MKNVSRLRGKLDQSYGGVVILHIMRFFRVERIVHSIDDFLIRKKLSTQPNNFGSNNFKSRVNHEISGKMNIDIDIDIDIPSESRIKSALSGSRGGYKDFLTAHKKELEAVYSDLCDEKSQYVFKNIIYYRLTRDRKYLKGIVDKHQYFDKEIIKDLKDEIFVDCGAYTGDTIKGFVKRCPSYRKIYAFEPDKNILAKIPNYHNLVRVSAGAWNTKTTLTFNSSGIGVGKISENGTDAIDVDTIDNVLNGEECTFIKMDIEGSELNALKGASNTIKLYKPKLAICIYHKYEDFYEIPEYIHGLVPEYKFYIRHYSDTPAETVLYATL